jgi:mono/diheme cytochrome c family protein
MTTLRAVPALLAALALPSCDWMPGKPSLEDKWKAPSEITSFTELYSSNCLGCHADGRSIAGSNTLKDPLYLALLTPEKLRAIIADGVEGYNMPAFALENGGQLTDQQIDILVQGIMAWADPSKLPAAPLPPYSAPLGDVAAGQAVFAQYCASCHGADGNGGEKAGAVTNPYYLDLVSNQYLRTIAITGRPELGCPDFASRVAGQPMSPEAVSDVVAWLASRRVNEFGQPLQPNQTQP